VLYLPNHKAAFIHIPKCAGNWVKEAVKKAGVPFYAEAGGCTHGLLYHLQNVEVRFAWSAVRKPHEWYRSLWRYQKGRDVHWEPNKFHPQRALAKCDWSDFDSWVNSVCDLEPGFVTRMYEWYLGPESKETAFCNYICDQETLESDTKVVFDKLEIPITATQLANIGRVNVSDQYEDVEYTDATLRRVHTLELPTYQRFWPEEI
jgi:hypothetical protein